ncbi:MAG: cytochrome C oxidase subunit IV family protein [Planctomycetota bacterium]
MTNHDTHSDHDAHDDHVHVTPFWPMFNVFIVLVVLTVLTVITSNVHELKLGNSVFVIDSNMHILLALTIATIKGLAVAAWFMHLRYDKAINTVVAGATLFVVVLFIGFTLYDLSNRDTVLAQEGGGAAVYHPLANPAGTVTDAAGSIFPGGSLNLYSGDPQKKFGKQKSELSIMEYVRQSAQQIAANPPHTEGDHHTGEHHEGDGHTHSGADAHADHTDGTSHEGDADHHDTPATED